MPEYAVHSDDGSAAAPQTPSSEVDSVLHEKYTTPLTPASNVKTSPTSSTPYSNTTTSPPSTASSVAIPRAVLNGWTHKGTPSPRRVAAATNLGAIDENGGMSPDIPVKSHRREMSRVLNFAFTPTLHASRNPPPYEKYDDLTSPNGENFGDMRKNRTQPRRGGWCRLLVYATIPVLILIALGVGLGVGLTRKKTSNDNAAPTSPNNNTHEPFPVGTWSLTTFLSNVSTGCTPISDTWRCYPYQTYADSTTASQTVFNYIISSEAKTNDLMVSSSDNPFALTFANANLTLTNRGTGSEAYVFSVPMQKIVIPSAAITSDGATTNCYYNNTMFEATLYTKKAKTYPPGASTTANAGGDQNFGQWPYAVEAQEVISAGSGVPDCYKVINGNLGEKVDIGTVAGMGQCECLYMNYGT